MSQPSDLARGLNALRRREKKLCLHCGREFLGIKQAKYCTPACGTDAYWSAHREDLNRKRRQKYARQKGTAEGGEGPEEAGSSVR